MRIGLDFDNTIVCYDKIFYDVALEKGLIPLSLEQNKIAVRDYLRHINQEEIWTELQGYVYGARMDEVRSFSGVLETLQALTDAGHSVFIISHKTKYPFKGPQYNLQKVAQDWILKHLKLGQRFFFSSETIFFHETKSEKIARIADLRCDMFVDDLPEIICDPHFPKKTNAVLFDPGNHNSDCKDVIKIKSWEDLLCHVPKQ